MLNRSVYEKAIGRDVKALLTRHEELGAEVLKNLSDVGCEILAMGEVTVASSDPAVVGLSCYVWNITSLLAVTRRIKAVRPETDR